MELEYQTEIDKINNCPTSNEAGNKLLFRCVESELSNNSFKPQAVLLKPRYKTDCKGWGLSVFDSEKKARQILKNLPKNRVNYTSVASCTIMDADGVKHSDGKNKNHYTFYPKKDLDLTDRFEIINN